MIPLRETVANAAILGEIESGTPAEVRALCVSDTVVLYRSVEWDYPALRGRSQLHPGTCLRAVGAAVAEFVKRSMSQTHPVLFRGAIAFGECLIQTAAQPYCYLGAPIIEAYELEQAQDWSGVALASSAAVLTERARDALLFLEYPVPLKRRCCGTIDEPALVVNWLSPGMTAETISHSFGPQPAARDVERKRRNTLAFFDHFKDLARPPPAVTYGRSGERGARGYAGASCCSSPSTHEQVGGQRAEVSSCAPPQPIFLRPDILITTGSGTPRRRALVTKLRLRSWRLCFTRPSRRVSVYG
jgi:hypothetical protein